MLIKYGVNSNDGVKQRHQVSKVKLYSVNQNVGIKVHWYIGAAQLAGLH
jgi:hypothetical protein